MRHIRVLNPNQRQKAGVVVTKSRTSKCSFQERFVLNCPLDGDKLEELFPDGVPIVPTGKEIGAINKYNSYMNDCFLYHNLSRRRHTVQELRSVFREIVRHCGAQL